MAETSNWTGNELDALLVDTLLDFDYEEEFEALEDTTLAASTQANKPSLKRKRDRRNLNPFPRILKSDIRRQLPLIFIHIANTAQPHLMCQFFADFGLPHCRMQDYVKTPINKERKPLQSHENLQQIQHFIERFEAPPDLICILRDACIKRIAKRPGSVLELQLIFKGTHFVQQVLQLSGVPRSGGWDIIQSALQATNNTSKSDNCSALVDMTMHTTMRMVLDPLHRMVEVEFETDFQPTQ